MAMPSIPGSIALGHAVADSVSVSQAVEAAGKDDDGTEAETVGSGTTGEEVKILKSQLRSKGIVASAAVTMEAWPESVIGDMILTTPEAGA